MTIKVTQNYKYYGIMVELALIFINQMPENCLLCYSDFCC